MDHETRSPARAGRIGSVLGALLCAVLSCAALTGCKGGSPFAPEEEDASDRAEEPSISSLVVTPTAETMTALGETVQLSATAFDANGNAITGVTFSWSSSNSAIVSVNASGLASAVANGATTIVATADGAQGTASLTVAQEVANVTVAPASTSVFPVGEQVQLTANARDANGHAVSGVTFSWSSSSDAIASVDDAGVVTALAEGSVTITATSGQFDGTAEVEVGYDCFPHLDAPAVALRSTEEYETAWGRFTRYTLTVTNRGNFPKQLFRPAPDLAPCGLNNRSARTWVDIYRADGSRIYGFCAFDTPADLDLIWFAVAAGSVAPTHAYITLTDRRCGVTYTSNIVPIDP